MTELGKIRTTVTGLAGETPRVQEDKVILSSHFSLTSDSVVMISSW